ncbi:SPW repeat domain-containing protein [Spirosoma pollinicola]|uniref:Vitamin K epoxide reductase n=1 Tax=Spirosoma pollinicola TaxID=2057025 RepID=A0A2K8Z7L1_9BACT|nr:SPW repeat protein [Spirosoma pollinicola]AUD05876.1 vitamin K epoxide reductase [Spirosoma pollinicola]
MWAKLVSIGIGIGLMVLPAVWNLPKPVANHEHIVGPIIVSMAVISISESTRSVRYVNMLVGLWLLIAPWILHHQGTHLVLTEMSCGLLLIGLSLIRGTIKNRFGGGWRSLFTKKPAHSVVTTSAERK